ncbi:nuclear transport factor 2 family protein [Promicromonospora thailandica]|uniref:SnoaL-like domain-containing protein n=1 Tax=Promicromonospora thailandica TaxID=765201 RepID=A0A9X2GB96_9MICO|nr:nuclear transport factor 2 family protein [Promicromonospora thailandica]MCP2265296.1 SnoaL-like domain-containing protein [Promicromonospora thailandica]BFF16821.1 nuclear transport factor 2 family protein [Promicromonospora thailandica]
MTGPQEAPLGVADRLAVADVVAALAHAQDDQDWAALRRLLDDEVVLDLSTHQAGSPPTPMAADDLVALARRTLAGFDVTHHSTSNVSTSGLVVREQVGEVRCRAHVVAYHHVPADLPSDRGLVDHCTMRGYWELVLRRRDDRWVIARWTVLRTAPWEGSPDVYTRAAARAARS